MRLLNHMENYWIEKSYKLKSFYWDGWSGLRYGFAHLLKLDRYISDKICSSQYDISTVQLTQPAGRYQPPLRGIFALKINSLLLLFGDGTHNVIESSLDFMWHSNRFVKVLIGKGSIIKLSCIVERGARVWEQENGRKTAFLRITVMCGEKGPAEPRSMDGNLFNGLFGWRQEANRTLLTDYFSVQISIDSKRSLKRRPIDSRSLKFCFYS